MVLLYALTNLLLFLIAPQACATMSQVRRAFVLNARLNCQRAQIKDVAHEGISLTHEYIKKKLSNTYTPKELADYIAKISVLNPFGSLKVPTENIDAYVQLVLKSIELEKQFSSTHYPFFHGTFETKSFILRTMLEQSKRGKN